MARQIRQRKSTIANTLAAVEAVKEVSVPPMALTQAAQVYYLNIVHAREAETWSDNDRLVAANLAKTYAAIDELWQEVETNGYTITDDKGRIVSNPAVGNLATMISSMKSMNLMLGLSASQRGLGGAKQAVRNKADRAAREIINVSSEALLA